MWLIDLLQTLQMLVILFLAFYFVYSFALNLSFKAAFTEVTLKCSISTFILNFRKLSVVNYVCFHKYEIWKYYRLSKNLILDSKIK